MAQDTPGKPEHDPKATASSPKPDKGVSLLHLTRVGTVDVPSLSTHSFTPPFPCDADSNIYYQDDLRAPAIHKLNSKGEEVALFQPGPNTDKKLDRGGNFAVSPNGDLYELVFPHELTRPVFVYKSDGTFKSVIKLDPGFIWFPSKIAVFSSGQMLVTGMEYDKDTTAEMWPFTGIFAGDGSLLKEVKLEDDETLRDMGVAGDSRVKEVGTPGNKAIDFGQIDVASDGNAYLMRWTNPAVIYAISPGGQVVRRLTIDPGDPNYYPRTLHAFGNRLAILFVQHESMEKIMKVVDLEGRDLSAYDETRRSEAGKSMLTSAFYCYTENPTRFLFLGANDQSMLQFWIVEPR